MVHLDVSSGVNTILVLTICVSSSFSANMELKSRTPNRHMKPMFVRKVSRVPPVYLNVKDNHPKQTTLPFFRETPIEPITSPSKLFKTTLPPPKTLAPSKTSMHVRKLRRALPNLPLLPVILPIIPKLPFPLIPPILPSLLRKPYSSILPKTNPLSYLESVKTKRDISMKLLELKNKGTLTTSDYLKIKKMLT